MPSNRKLPFSAPYDGESLVQFLAPRAIPGVERVSLASYRRAIALDGQQGMIEVHPLPQEHYLQAQIWFAQVARLARIGERLRWLFDLSAPMTAIIAQLEQDPLLQPLVTRRPGLRVLGAWDGFELAVRAILGQQQRRSGSTMPRDGDPGGLTRRCSCGRCR